VAGHSRLREDWARRAEWEAEGSSAAAIGMREGYAKRPPCFCRVCVCVCVCVCGSVEHYGLLSVSKLKRSPTLASFNVAQAAGMELQSPSSLPFSTGLYCIALHCTHHMQ